MQIRPQDLSIKRTVISHQCSEDTLVLKVCPTSSVGGHEPCFITMKVGVKTVVGFWDVTREIQYLDPSEPKFIFDSM